MVAPYKIEEVKNLAEKVSHSKTVGLVDIKGIPSKQFQQMRRNLRGKVEITVGKNTLLKRALEKAKLKKLEEFVGGSGGLVSTKLNPFQLNKLLKENKSSAPAKPGDLAPYDIIIPAGDTSLQPGPILGELQKVGIKAQIRGGKIVVTQDSLVVKKGEPISKELANVLPRFGIEPREISLDMKLAYDESKTLYSQEVLGIDQDTILSDILLADQNVFNLTFGLKIFTSRTLPIFIQDAYYTAFNLALNVEILNKETAPHLLQKAYSQASSLSKFIPETEVKEKKKPEEPAKEKEVKEEVKKPETEKPKEEEKPEEVKKTPKEEVKKLEEKPKEKPSEEKEVKDEPKLETPEKSKVEKPPKAPTPEEKPIKSVKETPKSEKKPEAKPAEEPKPKEKITKEEPAEKK